MGIRDPVIMLLLLGIMSTTCTAFMMRKRDGNATCDRLQQSGMALYNNSRFYIELTPMDISEFGPERVSAILCAVANARTLDDVTDAIDPNLPVYYRDMVHLYYLGAASVIKLLGGVDGVRTRWNFVRYWADFAHDHLGQEYLRYDLAHEFLTLMVDSYGEDFLMTLGKGEGLVSGGGRWSFIDENDIIQPDKLARALVDNLESQHSEFAETSGLSLQTSRTLQDFVGWVTEPRVSNRYHLYQRFGDSIVSFLHTLNEMRLLELR